MPKKLLPRDAYTVGWICAIKEEYMAARAMLDRRHDPLPKEYPADDNVYMYGEINKHNVVLVRMPTGEMGKVSATKTAEHFSASFPNIKVFLFVGIGGALPYNPLWTKKPIHLGDVVVSSSPGSGEPSVVAYDEGKRTTDGFVPVGYLNKPLKQLISAVDEIEAYEEEGMSSGESSFCQNLKRVSATTLAESGVNFEFDRYEYPGSQYDKLFASSSKHQGKTGSDPKCSNCPEAGIQRRARADSKPVFHRGTVASGGSLIEDAEYRDAISKQFNNAICFEMEAAGVMDRTHCLVIRGITDYADSHRNNIWHNYAAATAAAFARQLLHYLPTTEVQNIRARPLSMSTIV